MLQHRFQGHLLGCDGCDDLHQSTIVDHFTIVDPGLLWNFVVFLGEMLGVLVRVIGNHPFHMNKSSLSELHHISGWQLKHTTPLPAIGLERPVPTSQAKAEPKQRLLVIS